MAVSVLSSFSRAPLPPRQWHVSMADIEAASTDRPPAPNLFEALSPTHSGCLRKLMDGRGPVVFLSPSSSSQNLFIGIPELVLTTLHRQVGGVKG